MSDVPVSDFRFDLQLQRIEVARQASDSKEPEIRWNLYSSSEASRYMVLFGVLRGSTGMAMGQASGVAVVSKADDEVIADMSPEDLQAISGKSVYDLCRRALESQGAQMDIEFEFSKTAPETKVRILDLPG